LHFGIHPAKDQDAAIKGDDFPVLRAARGIFCWPNEGLPAWGTFQSQFGWCRLIGKVHHDATGRAQSDDIGLLAASDRCSLGTRAILFLVIGRQTPPPDDILRRKCRRQRRDNGRSRRLLGLRSGGASGKA
jgi:hypothetical protein